MNTATEYTVDPAHSLDRSTHRRWTRWTMVVWVVQCCWLGSCLAWIIGNLIWIWDGRVLYLSAIPSLIVRITWVSNQEVVWWCVIGTGWAHDQTNLYMMLTAITIYFPLVDLQWAYGTENCYKYNILSMCMPIILLIHQEMNNARMLKCVTWHDFLQSYGFVKLKAVFECCNYKIIIYGVRPPMIDL